MFNRSTRLIVVALALVVGVAQGANAAYPDRTVKIICPYAAGGNTDIIARIAADFLSKRLGQPFIVENRGGGGGTVGAGIAAAADPDGYTLLFGTAGSISVNPNLRKVKYDPNTDFTPVSNVVTSSMLIVVSPALGVNTLKELIALASSGKQQINFASGGVGTTAHVGGVLLNEKAGNKMVHVPYKGAGDVINDLIAGRVQVNVNNMPSFLPHLPTGELKALAIAKETRSKLLPDVPTAAEAGLDDYVMGAWYGLMGPAGMPQEAVDALFKGLKAMEESKEIEEQYTKLGLDLAISESPAAFAQYMKDQLAWWGKVLDNPAFKSK
ncbi:MAG: tripartite tricarboxylate transporter substrate binding protein [Rhodospirillales bacterium]|jgi:tripartite-type tricarboxylate transporter receptor subunit TctC|nr:tripartite tricarboxylate transporter substrate binding protein [Rhodospirillales bacterium]